MATADREAWAVHDLGIAYQDLRRHGEAQTLCALGRTLHDRRASEVRSQLELARFPTQG